MISSYEKLLERVSKLNHKIESLKPKEKNLSYQIPLIQKYLKKPLSFKYNYSKIMAKNKINNIKTGNGNRRTNNNNLNIILDLRKYKNNNLNHKEKEEFHLLDLNKTKFGPPLMIKKNYFKLQNNLIVNKERDFLKTEKNFKKLGNIVKTNIFKGSRNNLINNKSYTNINKYRTKKQNLKIKEISFDQNSSNKSTLNKLENLQIVNYKMANSFFANTYSNINQDLFSYCFSELNNKNYCNNAYKNENKKIENYATMKNFYLKNKNRINNVNLENPTNVNSDNYLYHNNNINTEIKNKSFHNSNNGKKNNYRNRILESDKSPKTNTFIKFKKISPDENNISKKKLFNNNIKNIRKNKFSLDGINKLKSSLEANNKEKEIVSSEKISLNNIINYNYSNSNSRKTNFFIEKFDNKRFNNNNDDIIKLIKK